MRKFLPVLESSALESTNIISLEEEAVILDEARQDETTINDGLKEIDHIAALTDAFEDLAVIADGIDEASPAEIALIENSANIAVAGTDVVPEDLIPSMSGQPDTVTGVATESFVGRKIATESIRETAKTIWENIMKFLKSIWERIASFFGKIFSTFPRARKTLEDLKKRVKEIADTNKEHPVDAKVTISAGIDFLSVNYRPVKNEVELKTALVELTKVCDFVYGQYVDNVNSVGEKIASSINAFEVGKAAEQASELVVTLSDVMYKAPFPKQGGADSTRYAGFDTLSTKPLLGNKSIVSKRYKEGNGTNRILAALDRLQYSRTTLVATSDNPIKSTSTIELQPFTTGGMLSLIDSAISLIDSLEEFKKGSKLKNLETTRKSIESASSKASSKLAAMSKESDKDAVAAVPYYRSMLNFNAAFANWTKEPAIPMLGHSLSAIRAVSFAVAKSAVLYKAKAA